MLAITCSAKETIKIVMPFAAGGFADPIGRKMEKYINDNYPNLDVVLLFRPGGEGVVGLNDFLADNSKYTLYFSASILNKAAEAESIAPTVKKLVPVIHVTSFGGALVTGKNSNIKTWQELTNETKRRVVNIGVVNTTLKQMGEELFRGNPNITIVAYPGETPAMAGLLSNSIDGLILTKSGYLSLAVQHGVNPIAVSGDKPMNGIPPVTQFGFNESLGTQWFGLFAKPGTSSEDVQFLNKIFAAAIKDPDMTEWLKSKELVIPKNTTVKGFEKIFNDDVKRLLK